MIQQQGHHMLAPHTEHQPKLFSAEDLPIPANGGERPFRTQLLKWVGNKQQQAASIIAHFPSTFGTYYEPFVGSGGVLGTLAPRHAVASDAFAPLIEIWQTLRRDRAALKSQYAKRHELIARLGKRAAYERVLAAFNARPNGADLLFLCRACYGGVVRFRKEDGCMSTPVGVHDPIDPSSFAQRVDIWHARTAGTDFVQLDFAEAMHRPVAGDLVYCDPPYADSQAILYGAQNFSLARLLAAIAACKARGVHVALSIDGTKFSGRKLCDVPIPQGLFERQVFVRVGRSMLKRFQMDGRTLEEHEVQDRLLLTY
ncbi:MAG: DNA adenine methylase [Burkholderiales bacterium]|jgi:DNA adenine methylase|nr:DNA adenine methylase [Burkholderiales bacterium]